MVVNIDASDVVQVQQVEEMCGQDKYKCEL